MMRAGRIMMGTIDDDDVVREGMRVRSWGWRCSVREVEPRHYGTGGRRIYYQLRIT